MALHGPSHSPLPAGIKNILRDELNSRQKMRLKIYCALCVYNLIRDPYFAVRPRHHPVDPFKECSWVKTKVKGNSIVHEMAPPDVDESPPIPRRPWCQVDLVQQHTMLITSESLSEATQVINLVDVLGSRGIGEDTAMKILDTSPSFGFAVSVKARNRMHCSSSRFLLMMGDVPYQFTNRMLLMLSRKVHYLFMKRHRSYLIAVNGEGFPVC